MFSTLCYILDIKTQEKIAKQTEKGNAFSKEKKDSLLLGEAMKE